ncbi:ATP-binding protein [Micromonosporaceae bacterium Da 78-11]
MRALRTWIRPGVGLAAAVLALGLTGGAAATTSLAMAADDASSAELALRTAGVRSALDTTFQRYADTLHDLAAVAPTTARADLVGTLDRVVGARLDGAHQILIIGADHSILATRSLDGSTLVPTAPAVEPELARAMELAERNGRVIVSPMHLLPADADLPATERRSGFDLAAPVRDGEFRGWVVVSARATDLLDVSLRAAGVAGVATVVTEASPDGAVHEVARWSQGGAALGDRAQHLDVRVASHTWQVQIRPTTPLIDAGRTVAAPLTMLGATLVSLALAGVALVAGASRERARLAERAALEAEERARQAEERRRERESEIAGFAAAASETLHAPLHTIAGFTELLIEDVAPQLDHEARGFLDRIGGATRRMLTTIDELLTYTGATDAALRLEPVETSMLALDVAAGRLPGPGVRPSIEIGELPAVTADAGLLHQVIDQFVANAIRFVRHDAEAEIVIGAREQDGGWWRIEVADRGIGIAEEHRGRIFAPFHRAPSAEGYPGTGLGLAVCARIVALHGGEIGVEANPGGGSVFFFTVSGVGAPTKEPVLR